MVSSLSKEEERRGTRRLWLSGAAVAVVLFAACLVWLFAVPNGGYGPKRGSSAAAGTLANQGAGQSSTARNDQVLTEKSPAGGAGQSASGEAAQIDKGAAPLKLSDAQRRQIASYFAGKPADRVKNADFALSVGAAVPAQVPLRQLPAEVFVGNGRLSR
jgi:hypothetical protein